MSNGAAAALRFAKLIDDWDSINDEVENAAAGIAPTDSLHGGELRRKRAALKDGIARMLTAVKV